MRRASSTFLVLTVEQPLGFSGAAGLAPPADVKSAGGGGC